MEKKGTARAKGKKEADVPTVKKAAKTKVEAATEAPKATKAKAGPKKPITAITAEAEKKPRATLATKAEKKPRTTEKAKDSTIEAGPEIKVVPKRKAAPVRSTSEPVAPKNDAPSFFSSSPKMNKEGEGRGGKRKRDERHSQEKGPFLGRDDRKRDDRPREPRSDGSQGDRPFYKKDDNPRGARPSSPNDRPFRGNGPYNGPEKRRDDRPLRDNWPSPGNDDRRDERPRGPRSERPQGDRPYYRKDDNDRGERTGGRHDRATRPNSPGSGQRDSRPPRSTERPTYSKGSGAERKYDNPRPERNTPPERRDNPNKGPFGYMEFGPKGSSGSKGNNREKSPIRKDRPNQGPVGYMEFGAKGKSSGKDKGRDSRSGDQPFKDKPRAKDSALIRLNRFISQAGVASRRDADELIASGRVSVNGKVVTELGSKARRTDRITLDGKALRTEKLVYILLNKPKGFITTTDDELGRRTVMELVEKAVPERIYPVGRLDRETLGLLLFTNDGDLADRLTHPSHGARKVYHVFLDRPFVPEDFEKLLNGVTLEDGEFKPDGLQYVTASDGSEVGIELHSGRNRIVRRTFEHLGYEVKKLDRVIFAGITKKDLPRGRWRHLTDRELGMLKMNSQS